MSTTDHTLQYQWNEILCASQFDYESSPVPIFDPLYLENCKTKLKILNYGTLTHQSKALCKFLEKSMEPFSRKVVNRNRKVFFFRFVDGVVILPCTFAPADVHVVIGGLWGMSTTDHTLRCRSNEILCAFQFDYECSPVPIIDPLYLEVETE